MPVYYSESDEENMVFHVFLGCPEGSAIERDDRVEKLKKRSICSHCLVLMKNGNWVQDHHRAHERRAHEDETHMEAQG